MSDIPNQSQPVQIEGARFRSPVSESLIQQIGGVLNFLLSQNHKLKFQEFTASGNFTAPANIKGDALIFGLGAGGGGGGAAGDFSNAFAGGGGGGAAQLGVKAVTLAPLSLTAVTIAPPSGGGVGQSNGADGASTTFGAFATFYGGGGGKYSSAAPPASFSASIGQAGVGGSGGGQTAFINSGTGLQYGGRGANSSLGQGGSSGAPNGNGGNASGYGAGGGGAGQTVAPHNGGNGSQGWLLVVWFEK